MAQTGTSSPNCPGVTDMLCSLWRAGRQAWKALLCVALLPACVSGPISDFPFAGEDDSEMDLGFGPLPGEESRGDPLDANEGSSMIPALNDGALNDTAQDSAGDSTSDGGVALPEETEAPDGPPPACPPGQSVQPMPEDAGAPTDMDGGIPTCTPDPDACGESGSDDPDPPCPDRDEEVEAAAG